VKHRGNALKAFTGLASLLVPRKHPEFLGPGSDFLFGMCCKAKFFLPISNSPLLFFPNQIQKIRSGQQVSGDGSQAPWREPGADADAHFQNADQQKYEIHRFAPYTPVPGHVCCQSDLSRGC
jgi:hypothetical protein